MKRVRIQRKNNTNNRINSLVFSTDKTSQCYMSFTEKNKSRVTREMLNNNNN